MKTLLSTVFAAAAIAACATPTVSWVEIEQLGSRTVKVTYDIDEDAVVTLDILTNATADVWVSIGGENVTHTWGDVNRLVTGSGSHTLYWAPEKSWAAQFENKYAVKALVKAWAKDAPPDYMVVDLETPGAIRYYETAAQLPDGGLTNDIYRTDRLVMRKIPAKGVQWRMGSPSTETGRATQTWAAKETTHYVTLTNDYYIGVFEVTKRQAWYMGASWLTPAASPSTRMSYESLRGSNSTYDYLANGHSVAEDSYIGKLRSLTLVDSFDLPTEAQWEYACRAGTNGAYNNGTDLNELGWYVDNSANAVHRVGEKMPNEWGIYDMHGNVCELCLDWCQQDLGAATVIEPTGNKDDGDFGTYKTLRGGGYDSTAANSRSAYRQPWCLVTSQFNNAGFRLVCDAVAK